MSQIPAMSVMGWGMKTNLPNTAPHTWKIFKLGQKIFRLVQKISVPCVRGEERSGTGGGGAGGGAAAAERGSHGEPWAMGCHEDSGQH